MDAGALSRRVAILMPSLSRILSDLEKRRLIGKKRSGQDKRRLNTKILAKGRALVQEISPYSEKQYRHIEKALGKTRYRKLMKELDQLISQLDAEKS